jgi:hypothetical protein
VMRPFETPDHGVERQRHDHPQQMTVR